jgi:hypothetical protein
MSTSAEYIEFSFAVGASRSKNWLTQTSRRAKRAQVARGAKLCLGFHRALLNAKNASPLRHANFHLQKRMAAGIHIYFLSLHTKGTWGKEDRPKLCAGDHYALPKFAV